jgi:hypothetical protein
MADYRTGDFFPGVKVRLIVRIEEYGQVTGSASPQDLTANPILPPQIIRGVVDKRSNATYQPDQEAALTLGVTRYVIVFKSQTSAPPPGSPQSVEKSSDGHTFVIGAVIPHDAKLGLNGFKEPDTLEFSLRFVDFPFDSRVFRSIAVEYYEGTVSQDDYTAGIQGQTRTTTRGQSVINEPLHVVPDTWTDANGVTRSNLRFQGFVDDVEGPEVVDDAISVVHFKCTDNTRILQDQDLPPGLHFDATKPVDAATAQLLANFEQFAGFTVEYRPAVGAGNIPVLGMVLSDTAITALGVPAGKGGGADQKAPSIWDYLTELMLDIGHSIRVEGTNIIIQRVRTATSSNFAPRIGDPFKGQTWDGQLHPLRTFILGRNVKKVVPRRRFATANQNVEVRSYDPLHKKPLVARYPINQTKRLVHAMPGDGRTETKYRVIPVPGVKDQATLQDIAQHYYEGLNRAELGVSITTRDLASYGGTNADPDVLDLLAGDHVNYLIEKFDAATDPRNTSLAQLENVTLQSSLAKTHLEDLGYDSDFALAYSSAYASESCPTLYVVRAVGHHWDVDQGLSIEIDVVNAIIARIDAVGVADESDAMLGAAGSTPGTTQTQPAGA